MQEWIVAEMNRLNSGLYAQNETPGKYFGRKKQDENFENKEEKEHRLDAAIAQA